MPPFPLLIVLACDGDPRTKGVDRDRAAETDDAADTDSAASGDTDGTTRVAAILADVEGFVATSEIHGTKDGEPWCEVLATVQGTRDDARCPSCDYAFALEGDVAVESGDTDCRPPPYATWAPDDRHLDPLLGFVAEYTYSYDYEYTVGDAWFVQYGYAYTQMDVYGEIAWVTGYVQQRFLHPERDYVDATSEVDDEGFLWTLRGMYWPHDGTPTLWTACADVAEDVDGTGGLAGEYVVESLEEGGFDADRWTFPLEAGADVHIALDAMYEAFPGAELHLVRPDGCLGRTSDDGFPCSNQDTRTYCPSLDFVADTSGEWAVVVTLDGYWEGGHNYLLGIQADGVDVVPVQTHEDVAPFVDDPDDTTFAGSATVAGTWVR